MSSRLAIVIPTLERYDQLAMAVDRLEGLTGDGRSFELILVSDAAEPDPGRVAALGATRPFKVRHFQAPIPGAASARETGWRAAETELVLFLDSDVLADPNLVAEHLAWHDRFPEPETAVLGPLRWASTLRVTGFMRWAESFQFNYHTISGEKGGWGHFITANVSVKRELLQRVGGFNVEEFPFHYEDTEIAYRMSKVGLEVVFNRTAGAEHLHAVTLEQYHRRVAGIAVAERHFVERYPEVTPFFYEYFSDAMRAPRARGWFGRLLGNVSPSNRLIGGKVWRSADAYYRQRLARSFLSAWSEIQGPKV